jgi:glycosyltransferase involved in cell wall biosynthesis
VALQSITFTVPHQRRSTGGVYVIEQLARHLAGELDVTLAVKKGDTRPVDGVRVVAAAGLAGEAFPQADVLVGGLAQGDPEAYARLPPDRGRRVFLFQGYGTPGAPAVKRGLERRPDILAIADWLVDDARAHGCRARYFAPGLDHDVFTPGEPCGRRRPVVAMVSHRSGWKGTDDGLAAAAKVREDFPEAEIRIFGAPRPDAPVGFLPELDGQRERIARLWREAAVVVCPSWEEGLGLVGIEALACGAALATTDTKGSRDYATHERTALVSPPREPSRLAADIVRLLAEPALRERLAAAGQEAVRRRYPPWPDAARRFRTALEELLAT